MKMKEKEKRKRKSTNRVTFFLYKRLASYLIKHLVMLEPH